MAYRRRRRNRRKTFSKRQRAAIIRIAQAPVETKRYDENWDWGSLLVTSGYIGGATTAIRGPIYQQIPRTDSTSTKNEKEFIGNEIQLRGFRWEFMGYPNTSGNTPDLKFRFTVYEESAEITTFPQVANWSLYADPDFNTIPTWSRWNMQKFKIRFQRTFTLGQSLDGPGNIKRKYYIPIARKMTSQAEESLVVNTVFGPAKEINIYWMLEVLAPTYTAMNTQVTGFVQTSCYFKDA